MSVCRRWSVENGNLKAKYEMTLAKEDHAHRFKELARSFYEEIGTLDQNRTTKLIKTG